jgi:voltage-gated potassium channel
MATTTWKDGQSPGYLLYVLALSVLALGLLAASLLLHPDPGTAAILQWADTGICVLFFADFVLTLVRARDPVRYLVTWGWLDLASSIPMLPLLRLGRVARIVRVIRVFRALRSVRVLATFILQHRAQSTVGAAGLVALLMLVFGSIAILQFEQGPEANIHGPQDALWWSVVTLTTVGYGDRYPVTPEGRVVAAILMIAGVGLFGTLSGFVASWFLSPGEEAQESELAALRRELRELRELVAGRARSASPADADR